MRNEGLVPNEYLVLVSHAYRMYVRFMAGPVSRAFRAERAVAPLDGSELWVVLDPELGVRREASDFLRALQGAGRSPHTIRAYAGRVASFLGWCASQGVGWSSISLAALARFKHFAEATPVRGGR